MIRRLLALLLVSCIVALVVQAQVTDSLIRQELAARGISEQIFLEKMRARGVDYTSVDQIPPGEIENLQ
ncbi:MAG: hypothetical protein OEM26_13565, partial [Saprospiraceae bacterium]|nr:hypothetical protein [Saprospiraceae bacterium]